MIFCVHFRISFLNILWIDDISYNKIATQSHTNNNNDASKAVDGNTATCMQTKAIGSNSPEKTVWWKVDLGGIYSIYSISILFKNYDGYGLYFYIFCTHVIVYKSALRWNATPTWFHFSKKDIVIIFYTFCFVSFMIIENLVCLQVTVCKV